MNSTSIISSIDSLPFDPVTISGWAMFLVSEIMPFIRQSKKGENNGVLHTCLCLLKGSKCMIDSAITAVEKSPTSNDIPKDRKSPQNEDHLPELAV